MLCSCLRDNVAARVRNPLTSFSERVRYINYGHCYYFEPPTLEELDHVDAAAACRHFSESFQNPAEFRLCLTGNLQEVDVRHLIETYLASIPQTDHPKPRLPSSATPLPFSFPDAVVRENVRAKMVMPRTQSLITFPVEILNPGTTEALQEMHWLAFTCQLLETKLLQLMRFKFGEVYTVSISPFFGAEAPSRKGSVRGDVSVGFSCDPHNAEHLIELALSELERLQAEGPTDEEIKTILTLEARQHETAIQENAFWHDMAVTSYQSRLFHKGEAVDKVFNLRQEAREDVRGAVNPKAMQAAFCRLFPHPCRDRYTAITLLPRGSLITRGLAAISSVLPSQRRLQLAV
ncbi:hypothetical protein WJX84_012364 [Apatococcus fuscideae]|uniref:Peptidase M16 C-terminal domain-containing protein n=1 Tax=Apatococcus fuscideae TaxID=2026836 RepID=A0AAW1SRQ9_9CHLO